MLCAMSIYYLSPLPQNSSIENAPVVWKQWFGEKTYKYLEKYDIYCTKISTLSTLGKRYDHHSNKFESSWTQ